MNIGDRVSELRKALGLSQEEFGSKLGLVRSAISSYEGGRRNLSEQSIKSICREFNVNYNWLISGDGEMFIEILPEDEYTIAAAELSKNNDEFAMQAVIDYWKLDNDSKQLLKNYIFGIVDKVRKKE